MSDLRSGDQSGRQYAGVIRVPRTQIADATKEIAPVITMEADRPVDLQEILGDLDFSPGGGDNAFTHARTSQAAPQGTPHGMPHAATTAPAVQPGLYEDDAQTIYTPGDPSVPTIDVGINQVFDHYKIEKLGGESLGSGWSGFSTFQRCPYLWKRTYLDEARGLPSPALEIGILIHCFVALMYQRMLDQARISYEVAPNDEANTALNVLTPEQLAEDLLSINCDAQLIMEARRVFAAYALRYEQDNLQPLAVELHAIDPRTNRSCRYDMIAEIGEGDSRFIAGTYIVESKSSSRFDDALRTGWRGDGEILGQIDTWHALKLDKVYGKLRGVIVNLIGKQKTPQFERVIVPPLKRLPKLHAKEMEYWEAQRKLAIVTGTFVRARASCIGRYGKCSQWEHCTEERS